MDANDKQEAKAIADKRIAKSLRQIAADWHTTSGFGAIFRAEADRLTPDKAGQDFEGVKYVHDPRSPAACYRLVTEEAWRLCHQSATGKQPELAARTKPHIFLEVWDGNIIASECVKDYAPWTPALGEKVRREKQPERIGVVQKPPAKATEYAVDWEDGRISWSVPLSDLRPFSFAPDDAQAEKPEFEEGELVAKQNGHVRVTTRTRRLLQLQGCESCMTLNDCGWRRATNADILKFALTDGDVVATALRSHARQLAKEAR